MASTEGASHGSQSCCIIPPHFLESIINDESASQASRDSARMTLEYSHRIRQDRATLPTLPTNVDNSGVGTDEGSHPATNEDFNPPASIIPPHLLENIVNDETQDPVVRSGAASTLQHSAYVREARQSFTGATATGDRILDRSIYTSANSPSLPGLLLRTEGQGKVSDPSANLVYDHLGATYNFFFSVFGRSSVDDQGLPLLGSIHFNPKPSAGGYSNAFWNGSQMAFGDGDGVKIGDLSKFLDITAHELVHGITQHTAKLKYAFQSGALNESMSDVFAAMVTQYTLGQSVHQADWLLSKGFYIPHPDWALRSLKAPGTAHGGDPQVAHFRNWLVTTNTESGDYGGVHYNSGIPNHAFYLMCMAMRGPTYSYGIPGKIWYATLTDSRLQSTASFIDFATLTLDNAKALGGNYQERLLQCWADVGVYVPSSYQQVWSSPSGIGGYDLSDNKDRIFAFDYLHSKKTDFLVVFRPGDGTIWILGNSSGTFSPVYQQGDPGLGIGGYDLNSSNDQAFAFDYESSGKLDYIAIYRPGKGTFWILKNSGGSFTPVFHEGAPGNGIAGYDLASPADRAFAFDFNSIGRLDHIALYRPGEGAFWIAERDATNPTGWKGVYTVGQGGSGIGGYDLSSNDDQAFAYDYNSSGKLDHIVLYRPGKGICWILRHNGGTNFDPVYRSDNPGINGGIGGFNLQDGRDKLFAYDFDGTGKQDHIVCYRSGTGTVWILHNYKGTFIPAYYQGDPGVGIGNWDLVDSRDLIVPFDFKSQGFSNNLVMYRPGTGNIRVLQRLNPVLNP